MKFKPKCLSGDIQMALTNRGHLIPCCYVEDKEALETPEFKKLLKVSKVSEVEDVEEILMTKEWMEFEENLRLEKNIPEVCIVHCKDRGDDKIRKETCYDSTGKVVGEDKH
jgi:hypothetical protein